jgi:uncharacterized membrane protein YoaK (UPF0700 family)
MTQSKAEAGVGSAWPVVLALVAGYLDGYGLRFLGAYVSFMSGNTTLAGMYCGERAFRAAVPSAMAIVLFVSGSFLGNLLIHSRLRRPQQTAFGAIAALVAAAAALEQGGMANALFEIAFLSLAMGLMNPAVSKAGPEPVGLTFVTGTLNRMGGHLAAAVRASSAGSSSSRSDQLLRAGIDAGMWGGFLVGAILSGTLAPTWRQWALWPPCLVITAILLSTRLASSSQAAVSEE